MFFILCDNWKTLLSVKVYRNAKFIFNRHGFAIFQIAIFQTINWKEERVLIFISMIPK